VTPRYLSLSITDSVTLHCITLALLGSTIKLQEPSQETRNWGLPARNNPPLARNTQTTNTTNNNHYKTYTISLVITLIGDGSLHNVGMAPDVQALVLTHERIARWLCSAHDQQRCFLSRWSRDRQLRHGSTGAPHEPHPCCKICQLYVILLYAPFLRNHELVLEIYLASKHCNKLARMLLLLHPNYIKARTPLHPWQGTVPRKVSQRPTVVTLQLVSSYRVERVLVGFRPHVCPCFHRLDGRG
jgi:hypothetical protein